MPLSALPAVIGHRCARAVAPENTLAALRAAVALGAAWVEVDARLTADGVPVLLHDAALQRTTTGCGALGAVTVAELQRLDAGAWFAAEFAGERVPTLEAFLRAASESRVGVNLELKGDGGADPAAVAAAALAVFARVWPDTAPLPLISSFEVPCLEAAIRLAPAWPRGLLLDRIEPTWVADAERLAVAAIIVNHRRLTGPGMVAALAAGGRPVLVYTVNDPVRARMLRDWGVAAVITDRPDRAMIEAVG